MDTNITIERGSGPPGPLLLRHQAGAAVATGLDFAVMILLVRALGASPTLATAIGATTGAICNFALGRSWIFRRNDPHLFSQAARYACVSLGSLGLNVVGEYVACSVLAVPYLPARVVLALAVGVLWNFPLHRGFVFPASRGNR